MPQVIQARCPHCKNVLRLPAEWLGQAMRCKHCGQTFQARTRGPAAGAKPAAPARAAAGRPAPVAAPAPAAGGLFNFDDPSAPVRRYRRRRGGWWKGLLLVVALLAIAGATWVFAGPQLQEIFARKTRSPEGKSQAVAQVKGERARPTARERPVVDTPPRSTGGEKRPATTREPDRPKGTEKVRPRDDNPPPKTGGPATPKGGEKTRPRDNDNPPVKGPGPKKGPPNPKKGPPGGSILFPRRALAISVCEYWLANPLGYGRGRDANFPGSSTKAVLNALGNFNLKFPNTQLTELSDQGLEPHPPLKPVIEATITDFLSSSRAQDRIVLLFAGHATEIGNEAYLVPILGDLKDAKTLIPLRWVYDQLKACKARQKVLVLDVCRFDPARGMERPGSEKMGKVLDAMLQAPPDGVQVWSSCVAGQNSYEFESGSLFLQALCLAMNERLPGFQEPTDPLPLDVLLGRVNTLLTGFLGRLKLAQTTRLTGHEMNGGAAYDPGEPLPRPVVVRPAPVPGGEVASASSVQKVVDEIAAIPPPRAGRPGVQDTLAVKALPPFPAKVLDEYKADYRSWDEFADKGDKFPLRAAVAKAAKVLEENANKFRMKEFFGGASNQAVKKAVLKEQAAPGKAILSLKEALEDLQKAGEKRKREKSKRWQANYDYVMARLKSRLVYLYQYDYVLAKIRTDSLPPLDEGASGYRLGSQKKVTVPESEVKNWVKEIDRAWAKIIHDYPETPWELIARREQLTALGLEWRPSRE